VISITTFTVGGDGKLNVVAENKLDGSTTKWSATKQ
jgi:hypothetical protein